MAASELGTVEAIAMIGVLGVGAQWVAWRLKLPAIVLMLGAGLLVGPVLGLLDPSAQFADLLKPFIALAVAVILFEGGLTLDLHKLGEARQGVIRLVVLGAPLGWLFSTLALHYGAGLGWEASAVFGGIMVVTGPTVIAPLLRQAKLAKRPANLLQWEAIVNDPVGALAAVLAFEIVVVTRSAESLGTAFATLAIGIIFASLVGWAAGRLIAFSFKHGHVPEYMKIPVLVVVLLACFAGPDMVLHESGLLSVTIMGLIIANANLPSFTELYRFKEHATILLVSGVFIMLAASMDFATLGQLTWRAALFVGMVVLMARPLTVMLALIGSDVPVKERLLIALTGPRGVVLVAVAGLFGTRLTELGIEDGVLIGPLAFVLVLATVVLHGFTLGPIARALGLASQDKNGVLMVGGSRFTTALGTALMREGVEVQIADPNHGQLFRPRSANVPVYYGDILSHGAEERLDFHRYQTVIAASNNDAYNTLVATDLGMEMGRTQAWQITRRKDTTSSHALPTQLGGRSFGAGKTYSELDDLMRAGWDVSITGLTDQFDYEAWAQEHPNALLLASLSDSGALKRPTEEPKYKSGTQLIALTPPS